MVGCLGMKNINLTSDNVDGCSPEILHALTVASVGSAAGYGADDWTARAQDSFREVFEKPDLVMWPVITGTAANSLSLSALCPPWGSIICQQDSHVMGDEAAAPTVLGGGVQLIPVPGEQAKLSPEGVEVAFSRSSSHGIHRARAAAVTLTQATELGTVYSLDEIEAVCSVARCLGMAVHMDGARFANAVMATGVSPADMTWRAGVDALSFGATKNGAWAAEAVLFFDPRHADTFGHLLKRTGHLLSKSRFVSAQLEAMLDDGLWLRNAYNANAMAARLAAGLGDLPGVELVMPVQVNEVFVRLAPGMADALSASGIGFCPWSDLGPDVVRMVCSFATSVEDVDSVLEMVQTLSGSLSGVG